MSALRKNVASQVITFALVNSGTGAALTGASVTVKATLDGTQSPGAGTVTELGSGEYKYVPTQGETNGTTLGILFTASSAIPVHVHCFITATDPTDAVRMGLTALPNAVASASGGLPTLNADLKVDAIPIARRNTAQAGTSTTLTLDASASAVDDYYKGQGIIWTSGANVGVVRTITSYVGSTKVATFARALPATADATPTFIVTEVTHMLPGTDGKALVSTDAQDLSGSFTINLGKWLTVAPNALISGRVDANAQVVGDKTGYSLTQTFPTNFSTLVIDSSGRIDLSKWAGVAVNALIAGRVDANAQVVGDKTGYSLTQTFPTNFSSLSIDASGRVDLGKWVGVAPNALVQGKVDSATVIRSSTAQAGAAGSITLDSGASATTDFFKGTWILIVSGTGIGQVRLCTAYNGSTKVASIAPNWATSPDVTSVFIIIPGAGVDVELWGAVTPNALQSGRVDSYVGALASGVIAAATFAANALDAVWSTAARTLTAFGFSVTVGTNNDKTGYALTAGEHTSIASDAQTGLTAQGYTTTRATYLDTLNGLVQAIWDKATSALTVVGSIGKLLVDNINATISSRSTYAGTDTPGTTSLLTRIPAALVSGRMDSSVGAMATDVVTAASIAAGAIGVSEAPNLDAAISTRLATSAYTAPDNASIASILAQLPEGIPKNVAYPNFQFLMVLASDHITPAPGLTVSAQHLIDNGSWAACTNTGTIRDKSNGVYEIDLSAADLNGDAVSLRFSASTADDTVISLTTS